MNRFSTRRILNLDFITLREKLLHMIQKQFVFNQLIQFIPKDYFEWLVRRYNGNSGLKGYSCWNHLLVMIWAQLKSQKSLREIETSLRANSDKIYRMGIGNHISKSNIAYANANRNVGIFRDLAQEMMRRTSKISIRDEILELIEDAFTVSGFFAIDSSTVTLDLNKFDWSVPQKEHGGIKIHTMFDLLRQVPLIALITGHEERDQTFMEDYPFNKNCFYIMDKAYCKTVGLNRINEAGAFFVVRIKKNMVYEIISESPVNGNVVLADQIIRFTSRWAQKGYPHKLRMITYYSPEKNETFRYITNNTLIDAAVIALLYLYRWQIEKFFKWIKQHLRITSFFGYSENAVIIQIYTAFISYCIIALAADNYGFNGSLYEFANIVEATLTEKEWMDKILDRYKGIDNDVGDSYKPPTLFDEP